MFNYTSRRSSQAGAQKNDGARGVNGPPPMQELGAMLRKRREAMGATLAEVEAATKIRQKYLAALEADEWQLLPGEVVGRGFLRNYATYLGLDSTELIERRRAVADPSLAATLISTSAGAPLPGPRQVDYRPKDMPLHDEPDGIEQRREVRWGPFFAVVGMVIVLLALVWTVSTFGGRIGSGFSALVGGLRTWSQTAFTRTAATPTPPAQVAADSGENVPGSGEAGTPAGPPAAGSLSMTATATSAIALILVPTDTPTPSPPAEAPTNTPLAAAPPPTPVPTDTPLPPPTPTETPLPTPTPTDTPAETPTSTPPSVAAPICPDAAHTALTAPGENQVVSGNVGIAGRAIHENFQYYKLEFAPGANAGDGFVYFAGANSPVDGGLLGTFSSGAVGNGAYTLRVTVVDNTGNFPPPCQVTVFVQN